MGKGVFRVEDVTLAVLEPDVVVIVHWTVVLELFPKLEVFNVNKTEDEPQIFKVLLKCCGFVVKSANCPSTFNERKQTTAKRNILKRVESVFKSLIFRTKLQKSVLRKNL
jgi:hypothetical protein